jgi:hypothetical protein
MMKKIEIFIKASTKKETPGQKLRASKNPEVSRVL